MHQVAVINPDGSVTYHSAMPGGIIPIQSPGAVNGGYWAPPAAAYYNPFGQPHQGYTGASALIAQQHASMLAQQAAYWGPGNFTGFANTQQPAAAEPLEDAGITAGEIEAWRCWKINSGRLLESMAVGTIWGWDEPMEGSLSSGVGVHAWKKLSKALEYALNYAGHRIAIGKIKLWGEVIEHEHGYRAEFGKVASIEDILGPKYRWWSRKRTLRRLRERYGV